MSANKTTTRDQDRPRRIADEPLPEPASKQPTVHSPVTPTGLPVEEQIEKEWDNNKDGGLPTPLPAAPQDKGRT